MLSTVQGGITCCCFWKIYMETGDKPEFHDSQFSIIEETLSGISMSRRFTFEFCN